MIFSRRSCLAGLTAAAAAPMIARPAWASAPLQLDWPDLIPPEANFSSMAGVVEHGAPTLRYTKEQGETLNGDLDGQVVRMAGFVLPTAFDGLAVTDFLLVPYVGACIHVPPPPPNQMVFVTFPEGFEGGRIFAAVTVTGVMKASLMRTAVAPVGYSIEADAVTTYEG